jgi:MFS transporter, DHA1 family, multidrug resistance protein
MDSSTSVRAEAPAGARRFVSVLLLGMLVTLGPLTIDLNLPAFPMMQRDLHADAGAVQWTITGAALGFGVGHVLVGPASDALGRRPVLLASIALHTTASVAAATAPDLGLLSLFRFMQGMGCAATGVVVVAIVRDLLDGSALIRMLANLAVVTGFAAMLAPVAGSQLLRVTDWRGLLGVVGGCGAVAFVAVAALIPESLPAARRRAPTPAVLLTRYRGLLTDRSFLGAAVIGAALWPILFSALATSPFLLQDGYGLSPQAYGLVLLGNAIVSVLVSRCTSRFVLPRVGPERVLLTGTSGILVAAFGLLVVSELDGGLALLVPGLLLLVVATAACLPSVQRLGVRDRPERAATAVSLLGFVSFGVAGLVTPLVGVLGVTSALPLGTVAAVAATVAVTASAILLAGRDPAPIEQER